MSLTRGQPKGDTPDERIENWLDQPEKIGESMIWIGKDYSLAQLKADVRALNGKGTFR